MQSVLSTRLVFAVGRDWTCLASSSRNLISSSFVPLSLSVRRIADGVVDAATGSSSRKLASTSVAGVDAGERFAWARRSSCRNIHNSICDHGAHVGMHICHVYASRLKYVHMQVCVRRMT